MGRRYIQVKNVWKTLSKENAKRRKRWGRRTTTHKWKRTLKLRRKKREQTTGKRQVMG